MAEPRAEQIKTQLVAVLEAIVADGGSTYWYTPHRVYRCWGAWEDVMLDPSASDDESVPAVIYAVRSEAKRFFEETTSGGMRAEMEVFILLARRDESPTVNPADEVAPIRDTIADRMEADILAALFTDVNLRATVDNITDPGAGLDSQNVLEAGWVIRELHMTMQYRFQAGAA